MDPLVKPEDDSLGKELEELSESSEWRKTTVRHPELDSGSRGLGTWDVRK